MHNANYHLHRENYKHRYLWQITSCISYKVLKYVNLRISNTSHFKQQTTMGHLDTTCVEHAYLTLRNAHNC